MAETASLAGGAARARVLDSSSVAAVPFLAASVLLGQFVAILHRLGDGEHTLSTITPFNYTSGGVPLLPGTIRLGPRVRPYIIRNGTVLRPGGR